MRISLHCYLQHYTFTRFPVFLQNLKCIEQVRDEFLERERSFMLIIKGLELRSSFFLSPWICKAFIASRPHLMLRNQASASVSRHNSLSKVKTLFESILKVNPFSGAVWIYCVLRSRLSHSTPSSRFFLITYDNGAPFLLMIESKYMYTDSSYLFQLTYLNFSGLSAASSLSNSESISAKDIYSLASWRYRSKSNDSPRRLLSVKNQDKACNSLIPRSPNC